jgi:hypothetical protein
MGERFSENPVFHTPALKGGQNKSIFPRIGQRSSPEKFTSSPVHKFTCSLPQASSVIKQVKLPHPGIEACKEQVNK